MPHPDNGQRVTDQLCGVPSVPTASPPPPAIRLGARRLRPSVVFDTYWQFAAERQAIFHRRLRGQPRPWTADPILRRHKFTNAYRASDRVSQYLIRHVLYTGSQEPEELVFRALLFKLLNRVGTWELLTRELGGPVTWDGYSHTSYNRILDQALVRGERIYSVAYIVPPAAFGESRKHANHLRLLEYLMTDGAPAKLTQARSLRAVFEVLRGHPSLGGFLAYQFAIDLNYSTLLDHSEMDFVVAGPGARDGISKCFADTGGLTEADVIRYMTDHAPEHFARLGLEFQDLWGRPLQLIDAQNLFCEVSKYARVAHPEAKGIAGRTRIKQMFTPLPSLDDYRYPPRWGLPAAVTAQLRQAAHTAASARAGHP